MIRAWFASHKSLAVTSLSSTVVVAVVSTLAVISGGYPAQKMHLDDGAVWVANQSRGMLGRANTRVAQLDTVVDGSSKRVEVVQSGTDVLMVDSGQNTVARVDPATSKVGKGVPLPAGDPDVGLSGSTAVIASGSTGRVWSLPVGQLDDFTSEAQPNVDFGGRAVTSLAPDGTMYAYLPGTRQLRRVNVVAGGTVETVARIPIRKAGDRVGVTSIGGDWAVLDSTTGTLQLPSGRVRLAGLLDGAEDAVVERPAAHGDAVYVASSTGLIEVPLDGGPARRIRSGALGSPAAPVSVAGCVHAGWAGGSSWERCPGAADRTGTLARMPSGAALRFQVDGERVVLNDVDSGISWAVTNGNAVIDNWDELATKKSRTETVENNTVDKPPTYDKTQKPPVAVDDKLGARPGRANPLPVLMNDYDPNGDALVISSVTPIPTAQGRVDIVDNAQQLQITLPADAHGTIGFDYTITDGRGGSASAHVTVTVRTPDENSPPRQFRRSKALVRAGGRVTTQVLSDWYDPDGDPMYLASASVDKPDSVTFTPQGAVTFTDAGKGDGVEPVALEVSDSRAVGSGTLSVTVRPDGSVPIITDPFVVTATAGQQTRITPLPHARGGSAALRLSSVQGDDDVTLTPDYQAGTFRFLSTAVGSHYVDYAVTDGTTTATGTVRVEVHQAAEARSAPITVPHSAFIRPQSTQDVDVLDGDIDPGGGVLLVTGVSDVPAGVRVQIIQQSTLRVTLTRPLEHPVAFHYTVTNGFAESVGTVTVVELPAVEVRQPPVAVDDAASVRVGDVTDIPVLDNDSQPDGEELTLDPKLVTPLPAGDGLLFAAGNRLRYLAPHKTGDFSAVYRVTASDGQWATATVHISVREPNAATNNPPVPQTVTARVFAGDTVRIPIPLTGIDPDGDSVRLIGQSSNPQKGAVTDVGSDWIDYQAGDYSAGTDSFTYTVVDALGARATGTVRVGIAAKTDTAAAPVAVEDEVTVRPGRTVAVQVLANDSDPDNSPLHVTSVKPTTKSAGTATTDGTLVTVTAPKKTGRYGFIYSIANDRGGTASNFLSVVVSRDAPLARPVASDTVLTLSDILGRKSIDVRVLANVFFADGPVSDLDLSVLPGFRKNASVTSGKRVRVTITDHSQIIPFRVANPQDPSLDAYAFIWVPGFDDALPQLKRGAPPLTVRSEDHLRIDLNKYVVAAGGKQVRLTDASTVHATHSDGSSPVVNATTLVYTSARRYFGPASISFQVTDGSSAHEAGAHTATLVLPITVTPRQNQPPVFTGGTIDLQPGQSTALDLVKLTSYPYQKDQGELSYRLTGAVPAGFTARIDGQRLTLAAAADAKKGASAALGIGVRDAVHEGQGGRIRLEVVPSTRPVAVPAPDSAVAVRGKTTTIDVLANDQATNPFPSVPLTVIAVRGLDAANIPAGVHITPSADKSTLKVTVDSSAAPRDITLQYEVQDATKDPDRDAWGIVRISIQDTPAPVANLALTGTGDRSLTLSWDAGAANNSPITGYQVTTAGADGTTTTTCEATVCTVPTAGNGPDHGVTVSVKAKNGVGLSSAVSLGRKVWSNVVPPAPADVTVSAPTEGGKLHVAWSAPALNGASPITQYVVTVRGPDGDAIDTRTVDGATTSVTVGGLVNSTTYTVTVESQNAYSGAEPTWNVSGGVQGTPATAPSKNGTPSITFTGSDGKTAALTWKDGTFKDNGAPISGYDVAVWQASDSCGTSAPSSGTVFSRTGIPAGSGDYSVTVTGLATLDSYCFAVIATNAQGTGTSMAQSAPHQAPGTPSVTLTGPDADPADPGTWDRYQVSVNSQQLLGNPTITWTYTTDYGGSGTIGASGSKPLTVMPTENGASLLTVTVTAIATYSDGVSVRSAHTGTNSAPAPVSVSFTSRNFTAQKAPDADASDPGTDQDPGDGTDQPAAPIPAKFTWSGADVTGPSGTSATYSCGGDSATLGSGSGSCTVPVSSASDPPDPTLTVIISYQEGGGHEYKVTYKGSEFHD